MPTSPVKTRIPLTSFGHMISEVKVSKSLEHFSDQNEFLNEMVKESHSESAVTNAQRACEVSGLNVVCISVSETAQAE